MRACELQFAGLEAILTSLMDQFVILRPHKTKVIFAMCVFFYLLGLPLCTPVVTVHNTISTLPARRVAKATL